MNARARFGVAVQAVAQGGNRRAGQAMRDKVGRVRQEISIQRLLEWAFADECAQVDFESEGTLAAGYGYIGNAYRMMQRGELGCRIDGGGRSYPDADADIVAGAVAALPVGCGGRGMALQVAELARARRVPDLLEGAVIALGDVDPAADVVGKGLVPVACAPVGLQRNQHAASGQTASLGMEAFIVGRKVRRMDVRVCPVRYSVQHPGIARARRNYLQWRLALVELRQSFVIHNNMSRWVLSDVLPPRAPWQKTV